MAGDDAEGRPDPREVRWTPRQHYDAMIEALDDLKVGGSQPVTACAHGLAGLLIAAIQHFEDQ